MRQNLKFRIAMAAMSAAILIAGGPAQALTMAHSNRWAEAQQELAPALARAGGHHGGHRPGGGGHRPGGGWQGGHRPGGGYHGGAYHGGGRYYHGGRYYGGGAAWVRPYRWAPGGAIAAGAAIGFVTAATAAAWASAPPQPGLCWYYTDPSKRSGFWDACPR